MFIFTYCLLPLKYTHLFLGFLCLVFSLGCFPSILTHMTGHCFLANKTKWNTIVGYCYTTFISGIDIPAEAIYFHLWKRRTKYRSLEMRNDTKWKSKIDILDSTWHDSVHFWVWMWLWLWQWHADVARHTIAISLFPPSKAMTKFRSCQAHCSQIREQIQYNAVIMHRRMSTGFSQFVYDS